MADPFQNVDAAGAEFIKIFADAMDARQDDPTMEQIVANYLSALARENPEKVIETVSRRPIFIRMTKMPFANHAGGVARVSEEFRDCDLRLR